MGEEEGSKRGGGGRKECGASCGRGYEFSWTRRKLRHCLWCFGCGMGVVSSCFGYQIGVVWVRVFLSLFPIRKAVGRKKEEFFLPSTCCCRSFFFFLLVGCASSSLLSSHRIWSGGCIWLLSNSFTKQADWLTLWEREREREREFFGANSKPSLCFVGKKIFWKTLMLLLRKPNKQNDRGKKKPKQKELE